MSEIALTQVQPDPLDRVQLWRCGRQRQERDVSGHVQSPLVMPARLVEDEHGVYVRGELMREVLEEDRHRARVRSRQSQSERLVGAGSAGRKQIQAGEALIDDPRRAEAALVPDPCGPPLLPDTRLILAPNLEALVGMLNREGLECCRQPLF